MEMMIKTSSSNWTQYYENGERVYPCRCGETHRGDYGFYDYMHHECFHDGVVWKITEPGLPDLYLCSDCGKLFVLEAAK